MGKQTSPPKAPATDLQAEEPQEEFPVSEPETDDILRFIR